MCELFACSLQYHLVLNDYLREFYAHSINHPHGWGLACLTHQKVNIEKEPIRAIDSIYLKKGYMLLLIIKLYWVTFVMPL